MKQKMFLMALGLESLLDAAPKKELGHMQKRDDRSGLKVRCSL
ncbi:MAG: hypothetical protein U9Q62_04610 [Campylobacterota bacterium]|nr:hypothetical protein [Campylobacterota bacterium]